MLNLQNINIILMIFYLTLDLMILKRDQNLFSSFLPRQGMYFYIYKIYRIQIFNSFKYFFLQF